MYVTKPLSHYLKYPDALSTPPDGPNSGYLVLQDEESEAYCCFGLFKNRYLKDLPFPQNKNLTIERLVPSDQHHNSGSIPHHERQVLAYNKVVFIPVLNQPLSSNRYYAIQPDGPHKGEAFACSNGEGRGTCCFCRYLRPLNPRDVYQHFELIRKSKSSFYAKSLAPDSYPPDFLLGKGWAIYRETPKNYTLHEAPGINNALRTRNLEFNVALSYESSKPVVVGMWYCPFMFVKEGKLGDQIIRTMFYKITLEQRWEQIYYYESENNQGNVVSVNKAVHREVVFVCGREATWNERDVVNGVVWYASFNKKGKEVRVGLSVEIVQRMKWEEERIGWIGDEERQVQVKREDTFVGVRGWKKFGCYVLVERFVLKRMDGSLVMTYDFKHTHKIKTNWE